MVLTETELIDRFSKAIARTEGFYDKKKIPTVAQRCNNPGNLTHWMDRAGRPMPTANGYVQFPSVEDGWRALRAQCKINIIKRKLTFFEFFAGKPGTYGGFCPKDDDRDKLMRKNDPLVYARNVLTMVTGLEASQFDVSTPITKLLLGDSNGQRHAA
jgi:hypothetical protein